MTGTHPPDVRERRDYFPRGLVQPEGGYRFSLDSLLLACFARVTRGQAGADLGCGCGVVGLGMLLRQPELKITGVELNPRSAEAARRNAADLQLTDTLTIEEGDVGSWRPERVLDFVVANPPYRKLGQGRASRGEDRLAARFEESGTFGRFARCAAVALRTRGRFSVVHLPERLPELLAELERVGLTPKRMRLVHGRADQEARMVLLESVKAAGAGLRVEPPLVLHEGEGRDTRLTGQALKFCPYLACNPQGGE